VSATMRPLSFGQLLDWVLTEVAECGSVFGIPSSLFYRPQQGGRLETHRPFGARLGTPFGPAAGPHTQLAQNIISAWLCGGRYIELKTVQVLDRLEIPRPCIDAADEGYNVEWSQELSLDESAREYVHAWALIHLLPRILGFDGASGDVVFNQSVGYTLDGVRSPSVQTFLDTMANAKSLLDPVRQSLRSRFPSLADVEIPDRVSDSVTLSTMHGCPPEEIERIACHLLEDRGLHTIVKLNPTLLGKARVVDILHDRLGFREVEIPDEVFEHDLGLPAALDLIASLRATAARCGRGFAVKLSNTLAMRNARGVLPGDAAYMSGRALYPITVELFRELRKAVGPDLRVSYSAGADAVNAPSLIASGACPVTVASDLLKPGGYTRLRQYVDELERAMDDAGAASLDAFAANASQALEETAKDAQRNPRYRKEYTAPDLPKLATTLGPFDCIVAPCVATCPACQDVPVYAAHIADGNHDAALAAILHRNPLPSVTGHICTARCETRCTRANLDRPVRIRDLKRFATERGKAQLVRATPNGRRVAVIGAGPSGLAAAGFLAVSGVAVTVFEAKGRAGGMPALAPAFRIPQAALASDVERIAALGVEVRLDEPVSIAPGDLLDRGFDAVYIACGFPADAPLAGVTGIETEGVFGALDVLERVAAGRPPRLGPRVLVVGGGNTAVDAARTALRLVGGPVSVLYRRTRAEMPADAEEVADLLAEGGALIELVSPVAVVASGGRVAGVDCVRNHLGRPGPDGRRRPIAMPETRFHIAAESLVLAVGQQAASGLFPAILTRDLSGRILVDPATGAASLSNVFAGGDASRGPATIIEAVADGRRAAAAICSRLGVPFCETPLPGTEDPTSDSLSKARLRRGRRADPRVPQRLPVEKRHGFALITSCLSDADARAEAERCLQCHLFCDKCIDVCPNRSNVGYSVEPTAVEAPVLDLATGLATGSERVRFGQSRQVLHVADLCNECGNCVTFCVHSGKPFADKPRLFLSRAAFDEAAGAAIFLTSDELLAKDATGERSHLVTNADGFSYTDPHLAVRLSRTLDVAEARVLVRGVGVRSSARAVELAVLWRGLQASAPHIVRAHSKGDS
jgi:putative selenate reductase